MIDRKGLYGCQQEQGLVMEDSLVGVMLASRASERKSRGNEKDNLIQ